MNQSRIPVSLALLVAFVLLGCDGLRLHLVNASVQQQSNVALYFTVDTVDDEPVPGLKADQFNIYEDGRLISTYESRQTILNPEVATVRYTLLLLDMSGSVVGSGQVPLIQDAVNAFIVGVGEQEKVAIYAFDGRTEIHPIVPFGVARNQLSIQTAKLLSWTIEDPSTNLNGAIIEAVDVIEAARESSEVPLRFGNIVVFTDGTDRAHRASSQEAIAAVKQSDVGMYVIGISGEVDQEEMKNLGRNGFFPVDDRDAIVQAFQKVGERIKGLAARFYLLSYCSPSRAGQHELEVEAVYGEETGRLAYDFKADDFVPECDPTQPPTFEVPGTKGKAKRQGKKRKKSQPKNKPTQSSQESSSPPGPPPEPGY